MSIARLTYPAGITRDFNSTNFIGSKLNGIRPVKIELLVEIDDKSLDRIVADAVVAINHYCGEIYYLGSKVWSRK